MPNYPSTAEVAQAIGDRIGLRTDVRQAAGADEAARVGVVTLVGIAQDVHDAHVLQDAQRRRAHRVAAVLVAREVLFVQDHRLHRTGRQFHTKIEAGVKFGTDSLRYRSTVSQKGVHSAEPRPAGARRGQGKAMVCSRQAYLAGTWCGHMQTRHSVGTCYRACLVFAAAAICWQLKQQASPCKRRTDHGRGSSSIRKMEGKCRSDLALGRGRVVRLL